MKPRNLILRRLPAALLPLAMAGSLPLCAATPDQSAKPELPRSVFAIPDSPAEGRDPFFPQSTRLFSRNSDAAATNTPAPVATGSLVLKSIVGGLAVINNHSFAPGEEGDVLTADGQRQHLRLVEIKPDTSSAVVEIGGRNIELTLQTGL
jgi:hypothetical protein